jgi:peptidoglycan/LPS O-acetylase OafA/YrhL
LTVAQSYRPDIDGLRAVAVLCVLAFHLDIVSGGYVGVDVFFVISGYLITGLIAKQTARGSFRLSEFFVRRVRRLGPALLVTISVTFALSCLLLSPQHLERLGGSAASALLSVSNVFFWREAGYFDVAADVKPLLHTWSLGVEEQFYLVWPAVLLFLLRFRTATILIVIALGSAVTLILVESLRAEHTDAVFFLSPFRAVEFAIGALLVWMPRKAGGVEAETALVGGLGLILWPVSTYTIYTPFPGLLALIPCAGAALVIYGGQARYSGWLLRNEGARQLGLISYSLYLVHWPLIVLLGYSAAGSLGLPEKAGLAVASIVLAVLLYRYIETPFRKMKPSRCLRPNFRFIAVCAVGVAVLLLPTVNAFETSGWRWRVSAAEYEPSDRLNDLCPQPVCEYGSMDNVDFVVMGDSRAQHLFAGLAELANEKGWSFRIYLFNAGCKFTIDISENQVGCADRLQTFLDFVAERKVRVVLISHRWFGVGPNFFDHLSSGLTKLGTMMDRPEMASVERYGLMLDAPGAVPGASAAECERPQILIRQICPAAAERGVFAPIERTNEFIRNYPAMQSVTFFDPFEVFCVAGYCRQIEGGRWVYSDRTHFATYGSMRLIRFLEKRLEALVAGNLKKD